MIAGMLHVTLIQRSIHIVLITILVLFISPAYCCDEGWVIWEEKQFCYFASAEDDLRNFASSLAACEALNATLASQQSLTEMAFINLNLRQCRDCAPRPEMEFWIGLVKPDATRDGSLTGRRAGWFWLDGSPYDTSWSNWDNSADFEDEQEPNNGDRQVRLTFHGLWADKGSEYECRYICKKGVNFKIETKYPTTIPAPVELTTQDSINSTGLEPSVQINSDVMTSTSIPSPSTATPTTTAPVITRTSSQKTTEMTRLPSTTASTLDTASGTDQKGSKTGVIVGVCVGVLGAVAVVAAVIIIFKILQKRRITRAKEEEMNRQNIHNYHAKLYSGVEDSTSVYSNSVSTNGIISDADQMKENSFKDKGGSRSALVKYNDTWTSMRSGVSNPYITNL